MTQEEMKADLTGAALDYHEFPTPGKLLLLDRGLTREKVWLADLAGVVHVGRRELMDPEKARFARAAAPRNG